MNAPQVAAALTEIGTLLELQGATRSSSQAYHTAARLIETLDGDLTADRRPRASSGPSAASARRSARRSPHSSRDGHYALLDELRAKTPPA